MITFPFLPRCPQIGTGIVYQNNRTVVKISTKRREVSYKGNDPTVLFITGVAS